MNTRKLLMITLGAVVALGGAASAQGAFDQTHPARAEVNGRLVHQDARIDAARASGRISAHRARRLNMADRRIRRHERIYASNHGGRISRAESRGLSRTRPVALPVARRGGPIGIDRSRELSQKASSLPLEDSPPR
jgi:hypothetical protein